MKRILFPRYSLLALLTILLVASAAQAKPQVESSKDNVPPPNFAALFNGHDLTGWKGITEPNGGPPARAKLPIEVLAQKQAAANKRMHDHWRVKDGILLFDGKGDSIATVKDFGDFELHVDWKIEPGGDSGVYLRGTPQVQIWDPDWAEYFRLGNKKGSGGLWNNKKHEKWPLVKADKPIGQWNRFRIKMVGDRATVHLNDIKVTNNVVLENYWEPAKPLDSTGQIELQAHLHPLAIKNVYVRDLSK